MSSVKTDAIVLRYADYGESDRMLTLLSPTLGLLSVSARGCRKQLSRNLPATELFSAGEYLLYQKGDRFTLTSHQRQESFYALRNDFARLSHGIYWLNLCEAAAQPGEECPRLFKMLLLSLAVLSYGDVPPRTLTAVFLTQFSMLQGFSPMLDHCIHCGLDLSEQPLRFDVAGGGASCAVCARDGMFLRRDSLDWLREAQQKGAFVLAGRRDAPMADQPDAGEEPMRVMRAHVEHRMEKHIVSGKFL